MKKLLALSILALMLSTACSGQPEPEALETPKKLVLNQEPVDFPILDSNSEECAPMHNEYEFTQGILIEWDIVNDEFYTHRQSDLALFFAFLACDGAERIQTVYSDGMTSGKVYAGFKDTPDPELAILLEELGFTFHEDRYDGYQIYVLTELVEIMTLEPLKNYYPYFSSSWGDINK